MKKYRATVRMMQNTGTTVATAIRPVLEDESVTTAVVEGEGRPVVVVGMTGVVVVTEVVEDDILEDDPVVVAVADDLDDVLLAKSTS